MKQSVALLVLALVLAAGFVVVYVVRRRTGSLPTGPYAAFMGGTYGLLLGLLLFQTTGNVYAARNATVNEAATLHAINAAAVGLPTASQDRIESDTVCVSRLIDGAEWALMRQGDLTGAPAVRAEIAQLGTDITSIPLDDPRAAAQYSAIFTRYLQFREQRDQALSLGDSRVPMTIWVIVFALAFIIVVLIGLQQELGGRRITIGVSALLVVMLALVVYFLSGLDRPYQGHYSVDPPSTLQALAAVTKTTNGTAIACPR